MRCREQLEVLNEKHEAERQARELVELATRSRLFEMSSAMLAERNSMQQSINGLNEQYSESESKLYRLQVEQESALQAAAQEKQELQKTLQVNTYYPRMALS